MKQLIEKYREKKELYVAFIDFEKVYDKACKEELWRKLYEFRVEEYVVKDVKNLYDGYRTCVK